MLIDRQARPWIAASLLIFAGATALYVPYARAALDGPTGSSWQGLTFAGVGSAMMLFALLLGVRKRFRTMRVGRAFHWMQGHVWFGLLSYPIIFYHAGFHCGGALTQVLMWLFTVVIVTGVAGLIIQQIVPTRMFREVPLETIYEQIHRVVAQLREEALALVSSADRAREPAFEQEAVPAGAPSSAGAEPAQRSSEVLLRFYKDDIEPFLAEPMPRRSPLATHHRAHEVFQEMKRLLPPLWESPVDDLQQIVDERRQLQHQVRLHRALHWWLLLHVPTSYALAILTAVHAVMALRYSSVG